MTDLTTLESKLDNLTTILMRANPPQWMTTDEAAAYTQMSPHTLHRYRKIDAGGPPFHQPTDRIVRYSRDDLDEWMRSRNG